MRQTRVRYLLCVVALLLAGAALRAQPILHYHPGSTRKIAQLTGDYDSAWGYPTRNRTDTRAAMQATDLGSTLEHNGKLLFLFGDTWGGRNGLLDTWGVTSSTDPWNVDMDIPVSADGKWRAIAPPGLHLYEFCVPSHGISVNGVLYVVYTQPGNDGAIMKESWMISSANDGVSWLPMFQLDNGTESNPKFVNVWMEERGDYIYIFGCGAYRASSPYLARCLKSAWPAKASWQYYIGSVYGVPAWSSNPAQAVALFNHNELGEFSCCWVPQLNCWVMLYNCGNPRGIVMRSAANPWGPWSAAKVIMDPFVDQAYGNFMHISWDFSKMDMMSDAGRELEWGGEYGPYIIPRFTRGDASRCELYYTMSSWNPYQVVIMRSVLSTSPAPAGPYTIQQTLGHNLWARCPAGIAASFTRNGRAHLTTYGDDDKTGWLWQKLPIGTTEVSFTVHGGHAEIFLLENSSGLPASGSIEATELNLRSGAYGRIVRRATGVDSNDADNAWTWNTRGLDTSSLALVVMDSLTGSWGFVSFSDIEVRAPQPGSGVGDWSIY